MSDVIELAAAVADVHANLDVLINNAGVFRTPDTVTPDGLDVRFAANAIAPYLLAKRLIPKVNLLGRVINLSSAAAQSPVALRALSGKIRLPDMEAYAQSKLALTMWSRHVARVLGAGGPAIMAVNPGSMLGTKMVKEGFGVAGGDVLIGADVLTRMALADEFADASGRYFDNDAGQFAKPQADAFDPLKCQEIVDAIEMVLAQSTQREGMSS